MKYSNVLFRVSWLFSILCMVSTASAVTLTKQIPYYGSEFYSHVAAGKRDKALIQELQDILESRHQRNSGAPDSVNANCDTAGSDCYSHQPIGYSAARRVLMGQIHLSGSPGNYAVRDVYCEKEFTNRDFGGSDQVGPGKTPQDSIINTEHTWPQSRFNRSFSKDTQKSDLHHLYPTHSQMNSIRGNHKFAEVDVPDRPLPCSNSSKFGTVQGRSEDYFEPPNAHKGNVARALFYFSVRYHIEIDPTEEAFLRKWHRQDPADTFEQERNETIYKVQGNRNPFIDHPELVEEISDF